MKRLSVLFTALAVIAVAQVRTTESQGILKQIIVEAQKKIKPALGETASLCFTDANYEAFKKDNKARTIAQEAVRSGKFDQAIQGLRKLNPDQRQAILSELKSIKQKTVAENDGKFGPESQTDAGVNAQQDIAAEIVKVVEGRLAKRP